MSLEVIVRASSCYPNIKLNQRVSEASGFWKEKNSMKFNMNQKANVHDKKLFKAL